MSVPKYRSYTERKMPICVDRFLRDYYIEKEIWKGTYSLVSWFGF